MSIYINRANLGSYLYSLWEELEIPENKIPKFVLTQASNDELLLLNYDTFDYKVYEI